MILFLLPSIAHLADFRDIAQPGFFRGFPGTITRTGIARPTLGFELYLTHINVKKLRAAMSHFRCSNHILKIETGRNDGTNEENRYCPY